MYNERKALYQKLEEKYNTKILAYITGDRVGFETRIFNDVIDIFIEHLDRIGVVKSLSLYLYTRGGDVAAAWNIINLLHLYCDELHVIVPHKAHSAGTLISIGAESIIMTKQATLSPIDPSVDNALNPAIPNMPGRTFPVSVEAVEGYLAYAKENMGLRDDKSLSNVLLKLSDFVHPLVLGQVYRSRAQIKMLAEKLLTNQVPDTKKVRDIISFLCSDSGSHDYTINRREAKNSLGLNVQIPKEEEYVLIKEIYDDLSKELELNCVWDTDAVLASGGDYCLKRGFVESINGGCNAFISRGKISREAVQMPGMPVQYAINNNLLYEGWERYDACKK